MTHEYTLLVGGIVRARDDVPATALAYAHDTVVAIGSDDAIRGTSRGDSRVVELNGRIVAPIPASEGALEVGGPATFVVLAPDGVGVVAVVLDGRAVEGMLPGPDGTTAVSG